MSHNHFSINNHQSSIPTRLPLYHVQRNNMKSCVKQDKTQSAKTALDLSPDEWKRYRPFKPGGRGGVISLKTMQDSARDVARSVVRELVKRFGARRVVLFGSVARGDMHKKTDIDLAVWGIPPKDFYRAVAFAGGYDNEWKIDLVDAEDCRESLKKSILKDGVGI